MWCQTKQYIPNKSNKYGIKAFTLADSANGYVLDTLIYTGDDTLDHSDPQYASLPQPARIVLSLCNDYLEQGRTVYTDRYYTSIPLAQTLESRKTAFTGTCMKNRQQIPQAFLQKTFRLSDDEVQAYRSGKLLSLAWRAPAKKERNHYDFDQGQCQHYFCHFQSYGNNSQQVRSYRPLQPVHTTYYSFVRKSRKWWKKSVLLVARSCYCQLLHFVQIH